MSCFDFARSSGLMRPGVDHQPTCWTTQREAQAAYRDARAQRAAPARERSTERERSRRSLSPATSDMDREAEEIGHLLAAKV